MLLNYFKITLRNLYKEKMYAIINISGLSLGIACCIILGLLLRSELTYDRYNLNHKRIFRIATEFRTNSTIRSFGASSRALGPLLSKDYPEIESYVRFRPIGQVLFQYEDKSFYLRGRTYLSDETVFDIFTHDIIYGDPKTALSDPYSMAVSESFVKTHFGNTNPIGKIISTNTAQNKITLVFADLPENSHLRYDVLLSINRLKDDGTPLQELLFTPLCRTYLLMPVGYKPESFQAIGESIYTRYAGEIMGGIYRSVRIWLEPLADIHLNSEVNRNATRQNRLQLYAFSAVAVFILLVACINYINLATARSMQRGLEVGMRKTLGANRLQLISRFLGESLFFTLIALVIGLVIVEAAAVFTPINDLLGRQELLNLNDEPTLLLWMLGFSFIVGLLSGVYPAFYLSSAPIITTLTGTTRSGKKGFRVRQTLVLVQFIISIAVIASTILMALQIRYVANKSLGFIKENKVTITLRDAEVIEKYPIIKNELLKDSRILNVSRTRVSPAGSGLSGNFGLENNDGVMEKPQSIFYMDIKEDFIKTMGMELVAGRDFSMELSTDIGGSAIVNETLVKMMEWKDPLGKRIQYSETEFMRVIGVVKDFHYHAMHRQIGPLFMRIVQEDFTRLHPALRSGHVTSLVVSISDQEKSGTLNYIQEVLLEFDPKHPFEYYFLEDRIDNLYLSEQRLIKLTGLFSGICILISCLGLFGLAAFTTEQRTKEIGIRKVLGATTFQIIVMLSRGILLIVLAASVVASLIAWFAVNEWLTGFAYHAGINPLVFVLSAAIAMAVAFGTVALQSFKTAQDNPVEALRYE